MIVVHEHTKVLLQKAIDHSAHAYLLTGPEGAGKGHIARYFVMKKLGQQSLDELLKYPHLRIISPGNGSIGIEHIRELQQFLRLQTPGRATTRRAAIIEDAHLMTIEAQNALLKNLEEPPADTVIILTSPATKKLRQTIYSRVQQIPILPISKGQASSYFAQHSGTELDRAYAISRGQTGLLYALLSDTEHGLLAQIQRAKHLMASQQFERLTKVDELSKQKDAIPLLLQACKLVASAALGQAVTKSNHKQAKQWHQLLAAAYQAEANLHHNPNIKLLLTDLFLHF